MPSRDNLAERIFQRFIERSGFAGAYWWVREEKPAAQRMPASEQETAGEVEKRAGNG
jgi:hypothetical protein